MYVYVQNKHKMQLAYGGSKKYALYLCSCVIYVRSYYTKLQIVLNPLYNVCIEKVMLLYRNYVIFIVHYNVYYIHM